MEDFSDPIRFPRNPVGNPFVSKEDAKSIAGDPNRMFSHSLSTLEKLPDDLHNSMLLWSFDPKHSYTVKMYLDWIKVLEMHGKAKEDFERFCRFQDRAIFFSMAFCGVALLCIFFLR